MRLLKSLGTAGGGSGGTDPVSVTMTTTGIHESAKAVGRIRRATNKAGAKGLRKALKYLLGESNRIAPERTGYMIGTGSAVILQTEPMPKGTIIYGAHYAIYVHEDLTKAHAPGKSAKFLEKTVKNRRHITVARGMITKEITLAQRRVV